MYRHFNNKLYCIEKVQLGQSKMYYQINICRLSVDLRVYMIRIDHSIQPDLLNIYFKYFIC